MSFPPDDMLPVPIELIDEVRGFLRLDHVEDDEAIAQLLRSAARLCENFIGQRLIARSVCDRMPVRTEWQKLKKQPVQAITLVEAVGPDGALTSLPLNDYALDIDSDGVGWVKLLPANMVARIAVTYDAGLATDWAHVPTTLRQGVVRLAGYLYTHRDRMDAGGPPSAVTALWRPHRRMRVA
ncbi:head-tail connector protein [Sphingorhabdus sp. Alg231-15]|uniref:head-tail connector protein n=1 Tax=Sphingorhabdus sp. Alg231-15 TaxID=1922222 RepID=UPI00307B1682